MATLYDRLFVKAEAGEYSSIAVHEFYSALVDVAAGASTKSQIVAAFNLDAFAEAELDLLVTAYLASGDKNQWLQELHAVMILAEGGVKYTDSSSFAIRMGL